mmetsp:Transcript_66231/g.144389  ORF Transcript_66231/g.144389 Transcript_66231/m.144389 type:complete len:369 (-) Transcript_66231:85-1191(-)
MVAQRSTAGAAMAVGSAVVATVAFVPGLHAPSARATVQSQALRGAAGGVAGVTEVAGPSDSGAALMGLAAATALTATAVVRRKARTSLRAEPVSAAMAAAAAAKAAAGTGAAKTVGAVAGSAGTGSLKKTSEANVNKDKLADQKLDIGKRGTPEYEAIRAAKQKRKEEDWEVRTGRNPDGVFGSSKDSYKGKASLYDPLMSVSEKFLEEADATFNPAYQIGVTQPLGYFDPLGFCKKGAEETFKNYRTAEIKHGRAAMMAAVGAVVQHFVKFPGFEDVPSGLGAVNTPPGSYGFIGLFVVAGALELSLWTEKDGKAPGDFGDPLGLNQYTEDMRNRELNNGRAAMFAAIGIIAAELYTGKDAIEQFGL